MHFNRYLRSAADQFQEPKRILAPPQQMYKKKSTSVGTKNQVESFLVILDSG
jgi:hypothetical protein